MKDNDVDSDKTAPVESSNAKRSKRSDNTKNPKMLRDELAEVENCSRQMHVLFLNDATPFSTLMEQTMRERGIQVTNVRDLISAREEWDLGVHDLILVDHSVLLEDRMTLLKISSECHRPIPIMMIFEPDAGQDAMLASENGAFACEFRDDDQEYLVRVATILENQTRKNSFTNTQWLPSDSEEGDMDDIDLKAIADEMTEHTPEVAPAYLTVLGGPDVGKTVRIDADICVIGRDPSCQLCLGDEAVSKFHAGIQQFPGGITRIRDLDSSNGTYLLGRRITQAYLKGGDQILLGRNSLIKFQR